VDLNGDGNSDLFAAGYGGVCYIFYGKNDGSLSEVQVLKDKTGTNIHSGMYYDFKANKYVTIEEIKNHDKLDFGKAFDWDNDGDLDLLLSGRGGVKLRINEGSRTNPVFADKNIDVLPKYHADAIVDWDGDGLWDIVCGAKKGGVFFYKNTGKLGSPKFGEAKCLLEKSDFIDKENGGSTGLSQVAVVDYNNDGKLDLIIGNQNSVNKPAPKLTKEQIKERDELQKKSDKLRPKLNKIYKQYMDKYKDSKDKMYEAMKSDKAFNKLSKESSLLYQQLRKYIPQAGAHGYVFISLRK